MNYTIAYGVTDLDDQGRLIPGYRLLGKGGDTRHLRKHGGHTPWCLGKLLGWIYAGDYLFVEVDDPEGIAMLELEAWLVEKCRSDYDTTMIHFFNINGRQYNSAGELNGPNSDHHLHMEFRRGHERTRVTFFADFAREKGQADEMALRDDMITVDKDVSEQSAGWLTAGKEYPASRLLQLGVLKSFVAAQESQALARRESASDGAFTRSVSEVRAELAAVRDELAAVRLELANGRVTMTPEDRTAIVTELSGAMVEVMADELARRMQS